MTPNRAMGAVTRPSLDPSSSSISPLPACRRAANGGAPTSSMNLCAPYYFGKVDREIEFNLRLRPRAFSLAK